MGIWETVAKALHMSDDEKDDTGKKVKADTEAALEGTPGLTSEDVGRFGTRAGMAAGAVRREPKSEEKRDRSRSTVEMAKEDDEYAAFLKKHGGSK